MSKDEFLPRDPGPVTSTFSVRVTLDEHEGGLIHYRIALDPVARESRSVSPKQLSERGESLAHLGIRALEYLLLRKRTVVEALDMANALRRRTEQQRQFELPFAPGAEMGDRAIH
ncbi:MAG: hypothetical protein HYY48_11315 [Gammaproteobacteria bacterium]|nr:hypothetical protein [Gammaproteobacteria bacterium]